jgi:uncharacterized protein YndB with AHSA1/START domain
MFTVEESVTIARPVDDVFAFVVDARNIPKWRPDVLEVRGAPERVSVGTTFEELISFGGKKVWGMRVTALKPGRSEVIEAISGPGVRPTQTFLFEPVADGARGTSGTRVTFRGEIRTLGGFRLLEPLLPPMIRGNWQRYLAILKRLLENRSDGRG